MYSAMGKGMLDFLFDCRHYELVVRGLNLTVMKDKLMVSLRTFLWHPKVGIIGSQEEITSRSKSIERQVKIVLNIHTHTHKHILFMLALPVVVFIQFLITYTQTEVMYV